MASKRKTKETTGNSLAGWSEAIRTQGEQSRKAEEERKAAADNLRSEFKGLEPLARVRALIEAHDDGRLRLREVMSDLRETVGLPTGDDE